MSINKKKKTSFRERLSNGIQNYIPLLVFIMFALNCFVIYKHERDRKPQIHYMIATNLISRVDAPPLGTAPLVSPATADGANKSGGSLVVDSSVDTNIVDGIYLSRNVYKSPFDYFMVNGCPHVQMYGRNYSLGSPTSRGIIVKIFPDAIILKDGSRIENLSSANIEHGRNEETSRPSLSEELRNVNR